ncbi:MAG: type II toxin-antitoxin system Phd/YefM family antitoxin [Bacteroidales bacterium]|jgi:antitoxin YefM|nr:type II toxin-antitoxin system Phd/YefM family antitoxin [Bacteroidales bacterium]
MVATTMRKFTTHIDELFNQVKNDSEQLVVQRAAGDMVILSLTDYNSLMETLHQLSSSANIAHLQKSIEQANQGKNIPVDIDNLSYSPQKKM